MGRSAKLAIEKRVVRSIMVLTRLIGPRPVPRQEL